MSQALRDREKASDAERKKMEAAINRVRLKKANELLHKLSHADTLIDEMVKHTIKVIPCGNCYVIPLMSFHGS